MKPKINDNRAIIMFFVVLAFIGMIAFLNKTETKEIEEKAVKMQEVKEGVDYDVLETKIDMINDVKIKIISNIAIPILHGEKIVKGFFESSTKTLYLTKGYKADLHTFLHEAGHMYCINKLANHTEQCAINFQEICVGKGKNLPLCLELKQYFNKNLKN